MIFLTVGNWYKGFDRLVKAVDKLKDQDIIKEDVIAQIGSGKYKPVNLKVIDYCSPTEFTDIMANSRLIISHAGMGTIMEAVSQRKPVVIVPRRADLGEANSDHQFTTAKVLEAEHKVLVANSTDDIALKVKEAENFVPAISESNSKIIKAVDEFMKQLVGKAKR